LAAIRADAERLAHGEQRIEGLWLAGYYFNDALFRISAVYHRYLQLVVYPFSRGDNYVNDLLPEVLMQRGPWEHDSISQIHDEVNTLKHVPGGLADGRTVRLKTAIRGSVELLRLLEAWHEDAVSVSLTRDRVQPAMSIGFRPSSPPPTYREVVSCGPEGPSDRRGPSAPATEPRARVARPGR
jgi:hypothetical protein